MAIKYNTSILFTLAITIATGIVGIASIDLTQDAFAKHELNGTLSGQEEVPPTDSQATGAAEFIPVVPNNETIDFSVNVTGIEGVTAGHIHSGIQGENGPVVVTLFQFDPAQNEVSENGTITANNLEGPMKGKTISDLISSLKNSSTYVNIHTEQNPDGEIRGQISSPYS
ncbi:MAG: CHRD domain-containing protein [Nitrosopumilus sp.]|nr:CHRD domain-containing protein [Nitrosopumilus sp.]